jgi:DNA-binding response OmpR family regulator
MRGFVAVIEDDAVLRRNLVRGLGIEGFDVIWSASDGGSALAAVASAASRPDALVLDLGLPDTDGLDLLGALRTRGVDAPALALTARTSLSDRLQSFGSGTDDYLTKPFELAELAARLQVLVRRHRPKPGRDGIVLDPLTHSLGSAGRTMRLTPTEYRLLATLVVCRGEVVRRAALTSSAWPPGAVVRQNTLDAYVTRLRRALRGVAAEVEVETVRGVGYRLR